MDSISAENLCYWCGETLTVENRTVDHLTPQVHGGTDHPSNLVPCCFPCNSQKGDKTAQEYREWRERMGLCSPQHSTYCFYLEEQLVDFKKWKFPEAQLLCSLIAERIKTLRGRTTETNANFIDEHITRLTLVVQKMAVRNLSTLKAMEKPIGRVQRVDQMRQQLRQIGRGA